MPQSLAHIVLHIIFSTRGRTAVLHPPFRQDVHAYLATIVRSNGCVCYGVGGVTDHVHLAVRLSRTITVAKLVEELKITSSKWIKTQSPALQNFSWQNGYAVFSVGPGDLPALRQYIEGQEHHHAKHSFQDELRAFLAKYEVEHDERYMWD